MPRTYTRTCNCLRCPKCRDRERARLRTRLKAQNKWHPWADPTYTNYWIHTLLNHHPRISLNRIADTAGISRSALARIYDGTTTRILTETEQAILAVSPHDIPTTKGAPAHGAARRLQALAAIGWTAEELATRYNTATVQIKSLRRCATEYIYPDKDKLVRRIYDDLSMTVGPSEIIRSYARRQNWAPPLAWDDDELDDPFARPHTGGSLGISHNRKLPDLPVLLAEVNAHGLKATAAKYDTDSKTVARNLTRQGYRNVARNGDPACYRRADEDAA